MLGKWVLGTLWTLANSFLSGGESIRCELTTSFEKHGKSFDMIDHYWWSSLSVCNLRIEYYYADGEALKLLHDRHLLELKEC